MIRRKFFNFTNHFFGITSTCSDHYRNPLIDNFYCEACNPDFFLRVIALVFLL